MWRFKDLSIDRKLTGIIMGTTATLVFNDQAAAAETLNLFNPTPNQIAAFVLTIWLGAAYLISRRLQQLVSKRILELNGLARDNGWWLFSVRDNGIGIDR